MLAELKTFQIVPTGAERRALMKRFSETGGGLVTSFAASLVGSLPDLVGEFENLECSVFHDLVGRMMNLRHEATPPLAQSGHYLAAIAQACLELPSDSPLFRSARHAGTHEALAKTFGELQDFGIDPDQLDFAARETSDHLAAKLKSLAQINRNALDILHELGRELPGERLLNRQSGIDLSEDLKRILIFGDSDLPPLKLEWLDWAVRQGVDVWFVLEKHARESKRFARAQNLAHSLDLKHLSPIPTSLLANNLFAETQSPEGAPLQLIKWEAPDPLAESEWAVRECLAQITNGVHARKIALYVRDLESYAPLLQSAASRFGCTLDMKIRVPLLTNGFARYMHALIKACASADVRKFLPLLKSSYLGLTRESREELQTALKDAYKTRQGWEALKEWTQEKQETYPWLCKLIEWREEMLRTPATMPLWTERLRQFLALLPPQDGDERDSRAAAVMQRTLAHESSVLRVRGNRTHSLMEFVQVTERLWEDADVSLPSNSAGIPVVSTADALGEPQTLIILGMLEGIFPRRRSEDPVLSDEERKELSKILGFEDRSLPNSFERADGERDEFYRICASVSERAIFSYPLTDDEKDNVPTFYLEEVERVAGGWSETPELKRSWIAPPLEKCALEQDSRLRAALDAPREEHDEIVLIQEALKGRLRQKVDRAFTPRELRDAHQCPFRFFARRVLEIEPNRTQTNWSRLRQLPQKASLASTNDLGATEETLRAGLEQQLESYMADMPEWEIELMRGGGERLIGSWVNREEQARKIWPKAEVTREVRFGEEGLLDEMGTIVKLSGSVGALSRLGPYGVVHLYETRSPERIQGELSQEDSFYYGLHFLAQHKRGDGGAIEVETLRGDRTLLLLPRLPGHPIQSAQLDGLTIMDLSRSENTMMSKKLFFDEVRERLREVVKEINALQVQPKRGEHCAFCDYGELCRRSYDYGEAESLFDF